MRIAVIAWSVGHNAVSRGWYLADLLRHRHEVELVGPLSARWGGDVWAPLRGAGEVQVRAFDAHDIACYLGEAERFAATVEADLVYVSKPRFPGALLGHLVSSRLGVPLVLDIDDEELWFAGEQNWMQRATPELIDEADALTVVSEPLERRYGGTLVGQARDEQVFDPERYDRHAERARLGYGSDEIVILFAGTPRRHKGVLQVAQALEELGDCRVRLCVIGSMGDASLRDELAGFGHGLVQLHNYRPITEVPRLLVAGDLVCLVQDPDAPVARDQIPMKLTEALAMGVPVLATATPGLAPYIRDELIFAVGEVPLAQRIGELLADHDALRERADRGREHFLARLSYGAVGEVLDHVITTASGPRDRPNWSATVTVAREQPPCPLGGPAGHAQNARELTAKLIDQLAHTIHTALNDTLDGASRCVLLGYPNHGNPGDHAIWLAAKQLLRQLEVEVVYVCDWQTYSRDALATAVDSGAVILLTGGGNFGDLWPRTQGLRERVLADFRGVPTVQLPQSVQFDDAENRERNRLLLEQHGSVTLMLRDRASLERAQHWFGVPAQLVPDLAFAAPAPAGDGDPPVSDIVWVARRDKESVGFEPPAGAGDVLLCDWMPPRPAAAGLAGDGSQDLPERFVEALERSASMTRLAAGGGDIDLPELSSAWDELSRQRLALACSVLRRGRMVVTDRLHAHVMALHLGLPSIVADNSYGKLRGVYDTYTEAAPTARWARTPEDALAIARGWRADMQHAASRSQGLDPPATFRPENS